jgi:hypothetical protein
MITPAGLMPKGAVPWFLPCTVPAPGTSNVVTVPSLARRVDTGGEGAVDGTGDIERDEGADQAWDVGGVTGKRLSTGCGFRCGGRV